jgi:plasmid stabilization system protein ParE
MDYRVIFSRQADRDLEVIVRFLTQKNPSAAERLGHSLVAAAQSLATFPDEALLSAIEPDGVEFCIALGCDLLPRR